MRSLFLLISFLTVTALTSQTLYWVGGSGNFNDPKHWSYTSGGASANIIPKGNTDVVIDGGILDDSKITIEGQVFVNSFKINTRARVNLFGGAGSRLIIKREFSDILDNRSFNSQVVLEFNNNGSGDAGIIKTGNNLLNCDFVIRGGKWEVNKVMLAHHKSFFVEGGFVDFRNSFIETGNFEVQNTKKLEFNNSVLKVFNELKFINVQNYSVDKSYLKAKFINGKVQAQDLSGITGKFTSSALVMSPCIINPTIVKPSCVPGCDGQIIITIPSFASACWPSPPSLPLNIIVSNAASCNTVATLPPINAPGTYTISNVCACAVAYNLLVFDQVGFIESEPASVPFPNVDGITISTSSINCPGACTGSVATAFTGGTAPYTFTVFPPSPGSSYTATSAGGLNATNLCAGTLTINAVDNKGCAETYTRTILQPPAFSPAGVTTSVNCFGFCTGVAAVTPTGGTASYSVNWSNGTSNVLTAGQTSSITNLCASGAVISATITDSKNCSYPTFTTTITGPPALTVTSTQTNVTCNGLSTGAASVAVSGSFPNYTYTWTPGGQNTNSVTGLPAGQYTVTIGHNNNLCSDTRTFNITQPSSITITPTVTNVTCPGFSTGSATVSASGGVGAITFTWVAPSNATISTSNSISNQPAGVYTVFATDNNTCIASAQVTITAPPAFTVSAATQTVLCFGQCNGGGTVNVGGGNGPPYNFTVSPAVSASVIASGTLTLNNLCVGNYTVSISDGTCSAGTSVINVTQPASITLNQTTSSVTCNGLCNGSMTVSPSGGVAPYTYTLVTPAGATVTTAPPFTGLCAGNHTVYVRDQSTCTQSFVVNILQPNPLVPSVSSTSVSCFNSCNGTLSGNALGGVPGYTLSWNTPTSTVNGGIINGVCANTIYTFVVTDLNGCIATQTASVNQPTAPVTATINATNPTCSSNCNGALSAIVAGGTPGYSLLWSNGFTGNPNTNLCAGAYTLTVTDANNCVTPITVTLSAPPAITLTVNTASPSCAGQANASATVTANGGTPPFTFQFNTAPVTTNTTGIITGLTAGNYIANVTDANGCPQSINFSINNPPVLSLALTGLQSSCNSCTGGGTVTPSGGVPGYTVAWTNSVGATVATGSAVTGLCVGNHTATVTDANGCTASTTASVVLTVSVTVNLAGNGILCFNGCTGSVVATPAGGQPGYTYTWAPTAQSSNTVSTATGLCSGIHTVTVSDANGCANTGTINLVNPPDMTVTATQSNVVCAGTCSGAISASVTGGTGTKTFSWSTGFTNTGTSSTINGLCSGSYTLTVTDANNCQKIQTFTITQTTSVTATFTTTQPTACGVNNGSICATASGGTGAGYTYTWSPVAGNASCLTGLGAGVYSLVVSDAAGCTATLSSLLTNPTGPTLNIATSSVNCNGGNTGSATITASGSSSYTFAYTPAVGFVNLGNVSTVSSLISGTYAVAVTGTNQCTTSQNFTISQAPAYTVAANASNPKCTGVPCTGSITLQTSGATPSYTFAWSNGANTSTVTNLCAGPYTVTITDALGCLRTQTFNLTNPAPLTLTNTASNVKCFGVCNGSIVANASGGTGGISYSWTPVPGWTGSVTATVFSLCPAVYTVTATDANNCTATSTINITQPATALTSTITSTNALCSNSCNATATHTASGGTPGYTYSWTAGGATTPTIGGLCAGSYSATITDANGCTATKAFTVTAPQPFTATLSPANPLCNSSCNGSITTTLSGAQGTVSFNWIPAGSGQNPTGLCSGNYTLQATDASSCQVLAVANLVDPPALLANVTTTNPACNAMCNGIAFSSPANAVGTVSYSWTPTGPPVQTAQTATALCAGSYTLFIQDGNGCQDTQTFTLVNPPLLNVNTSIAAATCGNNNGTITVSPSGGTPTYSFSWSAPIVSTSSVVTGLGAGVYTVVVTDANLCTNTVSIPLSNSNGPSSAPVTSSSITCFGACTGAASVNIGSIAGGTPAYNVTWLAPPSTVAANPQTNLCAGTYTAQITDALSCILYTAVTIAEPSSITIVPNVDLPTCNGICNGTVNLVTSGGTPSYTYNWTPANGNSPIFNNACAGTLSVQIIDANGCPSTHTVDIPAQSAIGVNSVVSSNQCFGSCTGSVTITNILNDNPFTNLSWSNGQTGATATGLCNGVYTLVVTDAIGCTNSFTTNITSPTQIIGNIAAVSPSCGLCNGTATATASGGVGPYQYNWTSGDTVAIAPNLCAGLYQVLITDNNGCPQLVNVPISNVPGITGENFTVQNELCAGMCNGSATVQAIGGIGTVTYTWLTMPVTTNSVATNLCAGDYFVQMMDSEGCIRTSSTTVNSAPGLTLNPFVVQPACGTTNGSITVVATGGAGPGTYTYSWTPGGTTNSVITNVGPGNYSVTVTSAGCSTTQAFTISNLNNPLITYTQTNVSCFQQCTGSITALGTSTVGGASISYLWNTGATTPSIGGLCPGIITLSVVATTGTTSCLGVQNFTVTDNPAMQLSISNVIQPACNNDCNGVVTLIPSGGVLPYTFSWTTTPTPAANPQTSLCPGSYTAMVTDALGCPISTTFSLTNPTPLAITNTVVNSSCSTSADGSASVTLTGGTPSYTYNWSGPASFTSTSQNLTNVLAGSYSLSASDSRNCTTTLNINIVPTITVSADAGNDSTFCTNSSIVLSGTNSIGANGGYTWYEITSTGTVLVANTSTINVTPATGASTFVLLVVSSVTTCVDYDTVVVNSLPLPDVDAGPSYTIPVYSSTVIGGNPTSATAVTFTWLPSFTLDNPTIPNPTASNTVNTTYTIEVTDANGCRASDTMQVLIYPEIKIPNGFSPNGDSKNDRWVIDNIHQFPDCVIEVYNRWGELLFYSVGYNEPFDGRFKGKLLPVGTYYYVINLNHPAYQKPYTGPLTIFR